MPTTSLLVTSHPTDPLPLYSRHAPDPETSSIHSSAPSYTSAAPSYHSSTPRHHSSARNTTSRHSSAAPNLPTRLPSSQQYAPGFRSRAHTAPDSPDPVRNLNSLYNIAEWSPISGGLQARHYQNVAKRRATAASENIALAAAMTMNSPSVGLGMGLGMQPVRSLIPRDTPGERHVPMNTTPPSPAPLMSGALQPTSISNALSNTLDLVSGSTNTEAEVEDPDEDPLSPHEDPHLVGEVAAARAREFRIYIEHETLAAQRRMEEDDLRIKQEAKMWDFMIAQMADWEERERSWNKFRSEVGRSRLLGRRLGLRRSR